MCDKLNFRLFMTPWEDKKSILVKKGNFVMREIDKNIFAIIEAMIEF